MAKVWPVVLAASLAIPLFSKPGIAQSILPSNPVVNAVQPAELCTEAARSAETRHHLPAGLLFAIGQVESGRPVNGHSRIAPWPWTVQAENKSLFFDTKSQAVRWTMDAMARGLSSIDTGCLQVNLFFHPDAFQTIDDAFDPRRNADYAARFLLRLYAATADWPTAAGYYHSQTAALAIPYEDQVEQRLSEAGAGWIATPRPRSLLAQLAEAWRDTATATRTGPTVPTGNDWSALSPTAGRTIVPPTFRVSPTFRVPPGRGLATQGSVRKLGE